MTEFLIDLDSAVLGAASTLDRIQSDLDKNRKLFCFFYDRMIEIRGGADQFNFPEIGELASVGRRIAVKAAVSENRAAMRRSATTLWDAVTTIRTLIARRAVVSDDSGETQKILTLRMNVTLKALGDPDSSLTPEQVETLMDGMRRDSRVQGA